MDAKLSCLLKGLIGVIFGGLALTVPGPLLAFFLGIFWIILVTGIVLCVLVAITSPAFKPHNADAAWPRGAVAQPDRATVS